MHDRAGEVSYAPGVGDAPSGLDAEASKEWRRVVAELSAVGVLQQTDRALLAAYCEAWSEFIGYVRLCKRVGRGKAVSLGYLKTKNVAAERLRKMAEQFGFSPAARTRVKVAEQQKDNGLDRFRERMG